MSRRSKSLLIATVISFFLVGGYIAQQAKAQHDLARDLETLRSAF